MTAAIDTEQALALAQRHLRTVYQPKIREVLDGADVDLSAINWGTGKLSAADCWIAFIQSDENSLRSSDVVIVSKHSGVVLYHGSLHDEG